MFSIIFIHVKFRSLHWHANSKIYGLYAARQEIKITLKMVSVKRKIEWKKKNSLYSCEFIQMEEKSLICTSSKVQ